MESTHGAKSLKKLPQKALAYIKRLEELSGVEVVMVSVGANREDVIIKEHPFK